MMIIRILVLVLLTQMSACVMKELKQQQGELYTKYGEIRVNVTKLSPDYPIAVLILKRAGSSYAAYTQGLFNSNRSHSFFVEAGEYALFAFEDKNGDLAYQSNERYIWHSEPMTISGEWVGSYTDEKSIEANMKGKYAERFLTAQDFSSKAASLPLAPSQLKVAIDLHNGIAWDGELVMKDSPKLSSEGGKKGFWRPDDYLENGLGGVFLLEEYDPERIPVVFVHGIFGYPQEFETWMYRLDLKRYQPWLVSYPSVFKFETNAAEIYQGLYQLKARYNIDKMHIVAHSIGGLVATKILQLAEQDNEQFFDRFITVSTPWRGSELARWGDYAPVNVPAWKDLKTNSPAIISLHAKGIPGSVSHAMLATFAGHKLALGFGNDNDGSVSLMSQLDESIQYCARFVHVLNQTHAGVLKSDPAGQLVNELLAISLPRSEFCDR